MTGTSVDSLLRDFDAASGLYGEFVQQLNELLRRLMQRNEIKIHSVTSRLKDRSSLEIKLTKQDREYWHLADITDLAAARITTYLEDDVDRVGKVIESAFDIDRAHSTDKRAALDPDQFGYASLHHVVSLSTARAALPENERFAGLKAEIQTRSILQHAWAEIGHDIGYKSAFGVPRQLRRRLARLAGLLELADQEFVGIRDAFRNYAIVVGASLAGEPADISLDVTSLRVVVLNESSVALLDNEIATMGKGTLLSVATSIERLLAMMTFVEIKTVQGVKAALEEHGKSVRRFAQKFLSNRPADRFARGVGLMNLAHYLVAKGGKRAVVVRYLDHFEFGQMQERGDIAAEMIAAAASDDRDAIPT